MIERRRSPRYGVKVEGIVRNASGAAHKVTIASLSRHGCRFVSRRKRMGERSFLTIRCGPLEFVDAHVAWRSGDTHGVSFEQALHPAVFDHLRLFVSKVPGLVEEPSFAG